MDWPHNAYVGQKVICIKNMKCGCGCNTPFPPIDIVYTILKVDIYNDYVIIALKEYPASVIPNHSDMWEAKCFCPTFIDVQVNP